jgi:Flp pilus assembly pilin Flp
MSPLRNKRLSAGENGQSLVEYALVMGFVVVAIVALMPRVASSILTIFAKAGLAAPMPDTDIFRMVCAVLAFLFLVLYALRGKKEE